MSSWGQMCIEEKDNEELTLYWQGYDKDPGGFKKNHVIPSHLCENTYKKRDTQKSFKKEKSGRGWNR